MSVLQQRGERTALPDDDCRAFDGGLAAYLEHEGSPAVVEHAKRCASCGQLLKDIERLIAEAGRLELHDPPATVWLNLRSALAAEGLLRETRASEGCRTFRSALLSYLEGEKIHAVEQHAEECDYCGVLLKDLELQIAEASHLPLVDPPPGVWANLRVSLVAEGLIREQRDPWTAWLRHFEFLHPAPVAAMAGLVFLGVLLLGGPHLGVRKPVQVESASGFDPALLETQAQVRLLESRYREQEAQMAPEVKADFARSLASLDSSIQEAEHSIGQGPETSSVAREYLQGAYIRKAEVLASALEYSDR